MDHIDNCWVAPSTLRTRPPFSDLLEIRSQDREAIAHSMGEGGFDAAHPIIVWWSEHVVIDGHTRLMAAADAGLDRVLILPREFADEDAALNYAIDCQRKRRNLTQEELFRLALAKDRLRTRGGDHGNQHTGGKEVAKAPIGAFATDKSAEETAKAVGTSIRQVERFRRIAGYEEEKRGVLEGRMSVNQAERSVKRKEDSLYLVVADLLVTLGYTKETVPRSEVDRKAFIAAHGQLDGTRPKPFSNGTLQRAYIYLGWKEAPRKKSRREREAKVFRDVPITNGVATPLEVRLMKGSVEPTDRAWLESLPARERLAYCDEFDADALMVRYCKPLLGQIKAEIERRIGLRSLAAMTPLHKYLHRMLNLADPGSWRECGDCRGRPAGAPGRCRRCGGTGYLIPGFTKG